jgi:hypothetical protein
MQAIKTLEELQHTRAQLKLLRVISRLRGSQASSKEQCLAFTPLAELVSYYTLLDSTSRKKTLAKKELEVNVRLP